MLKILAIILGIGILLFIAIAFLCAMVLAGQADNKNDKYVIADPGPKGSSLICTKCKVGQKSYELDYHSEECPHLSSWKNGKCSYFVSMEKTKKPEEQ